MTVDLDSLPKELAGTIRAARRKLGERPTRALSSRGPDPLIGVWAKTILSSGELDKAIAEVASSDADLRS